MNTVTFKGKKIALDGNFIKKGELAPNFSLASQDLSDVHLNDIKKISFFYVAPSLDTGVCLLSTKKIEKMAHEFKNVDFFVVTADLPFAQKRICGLETIHNVKALSMMRDKSFGKNYGLLIKEGPLAGLCTRAIFILNQVHKVLYTQLVEEIAHEPDYEEAFAFLRDHLSQSNL